MSGSRHPSETVLAAYAAGQLRPAFALVAAAHVHGCAACRATVRLLEAAGGALLEELEPTPLHADAFDRLMARIERSAGPIVLDGHAVSDILSALKLRRRRWLAPGVWMAPVELAGVGDDLVYVLRVPAGVRTFAHGHSGVEFTTVLKGAYDDGQDAYRAGDFQEVDTAHEHQPVISPDGECLCLIASESPMRMHSRLGRLVQLYMNV